MPKRNGASMFYAILIGAVTVPVIFLVISVFRLPSYANIFLTVPGFVFGWIHAVLLWLIIGYPIWGICRERSFLKPLISSPIKFSLMTFVITSCGARILADSWEYPFLFAGVASVSAFVIWWLERFFRKSLDRRYDK